MEPISLAVMAGITLVGAGGAFLFQTRDGRTNGRFPTPNGTPAPLDTRVLQAVIDRVSFHTATASTPLHEVPIVGRVSTPWVDGFSPRQSLNVPEDGARTLDALREMLAEAGRSDCDPRCYWRLIGNECGPTGVHCWWRNPGNMKANWGLYRRPGQSVTDAKQRMAEGYANVVAPECTRLWVVVDRLLSHDIYYGYDSLGDGVKHHFRLFENPRYAGVIEGYRQGGLDGLVMAERALARGGYSPETADVREAEARAFWRGRERALGSAFAR